MQSEHNGLSNLLDDQDFVVLLQALNEAVSQSRETVEGNIFYANSDDLNQVKADAQYAGYRQGFVEAISGRFRILEIGFNAGHSALVYLFLNPQGIYTGVDLAFRRYTHHAADFLKDRFGDRFTLRQGDSTVVLPEMIAEGQGGYDVVHVDGGHTFDVAHADIMNGLVLMRADGLLIIDDRPAPEVSQAIRQALESGKVRPDPLDAKFAAGFQAYLNKAAA
jgi:hypothetical protein